jgi:hypothetical protein
MDHTSNPRPLKYDREEGFESAVEKLCAENLLQPVGKGSYLFRHAHTNLVLGSFLNDLVGSRVESHDRQLKTLHLGREGGWQFHGRKEPLHSDILIPDHFQEYFEAIEDHLEDEYSRGASGTVYVTGSPGLGKSVMIYYLLHQILHSSHNKYQWIVYQPYPDEIYCEFLLLGKTYSTVARTQDSNPSLLAGILVQAWKREDGRGLIVLDTNTPWWQ